MIVYLAVSLAILVTMVLALVRAHIDEIDGSAHGINDRGFQRVGFADNRNH